jgi:hypothetical protein
MKGGITVADVLAQLAADPEYQESRRKKDAERSERLERLRQAQAPLVEALNLAGVPVASAWDLVNTVTPYPHAISVLLVHLRGDYPDRIREGILRALAVPEARIGWDVLLAEFERHPPTRDVSGLRFAAAVALSAAADDSVMPEVLRIAGDPAYGIDRLALLPALRRSSRPEAAALLDALAADPAIGKEVRRLRRIRRLPRRSGKPQGA